MITATSCISPLRSHLAALERLEPGLPIAGKVYFIAQDEPLPIWDLIDRILAAAGEPPVRRSISPRAAYAVGWLLKWVYAVLRLQGEPRMTRFLAHQLSCAHWFDLSAARRDLGYAPRVSLAEGLDRLSRSFKPA